MAASGVFVIGILNFGPRGLTPWPSSPHGPLLLDSSQGVCPHGSPLGSINKIIKISVKPLPGCVLALHAYECAGEEAASVDVVV